MPLFLTILFVFLLTSVMQLLQHLMELRRNRKSQISSVLNKAQTFIGDIEENDRCSQHTAGSITCVSSRCPIPTSAKIRLFLQIPLTPTALDSFLSATAHITPVM